MSSRIKAIFAGSFDPFTLGHQEIVTRAAALFGSVTVLVCENPSKGSTFSVEHRLEFARASVAKSGVNVEAYSGLLANTIGKMGSCVLVRGIRGSEDVLSELSMAHYNFDLTDGIETIFLPTLPDFRFVSASAARELIRHTEKSRYADVLKSVLPQPVIEKLIKDV